MVLNDIIEQAAGRQSRTPEQGGNVECSILSLMLLFFLQFSITLYHRCVSLVWWASYHFDVHRCWNSCTVFSIDIQCWRFLSERLVHSRPIPIYTYIQSISLSLSLSLCLFFFFYCLISKSRLNSIENYFHFIPLLVNTDTVLQCMVRFLLVPISFIFIIIV